MQTRLHPIAVIHPAIQAIFTHRLLTAALMASAVVIAPADRAHALPFGVSGTSQPVFSAPTRNDRPAAAPRRTVRPVATAARPEKAAPAAAPLASKAHGPLQILISLDKQELTLYAGGEPIAHSRVSTGMRGRATPTGVFSIIQKDRWHRSNLYDDAPMYYMQRITWSGVAMHQGYVPNYPASHGCIRLPEAFARQLWTTTSLGARVIVSHAPLSPTEISHPALFMPKPAPAPNPEVAKLSSLEAAQQAWKMAQLMSKTPLAAMTDFAQATVPLPEPKPARVLKPGPVSVFISRKEGKLFVRKGFAPVFDVPVTIDNPQAPLGTHVFTAIAANENNTALRWNVISPVPTTTASAALDRITIPQEARDQISELVSAGASLVISDQGLGPETGKGTDFIVLTR